MDYSISQVPSSMETKRMKNLHLNRGRKLKWKWNQGMTSASKKERGKAKKRKNSGDIIPINHQNFHIDGDIFSFFGRKLPIDRVGQEPDEDELPEFVYSEEYGTGLYSFLEDETYSKKAPPPVYTRFEEINQPKPTEKDDVLGAFEMNKKGYLECHDQKIKDSNKGVIPYVLRELAKNVFTGRGIVSISLPVRIFQPKSLLERILDACSFVPTFFKKACGTRDELLRMKYMLSFIVSGMYMSADLRKPFNPILGETLEGYFKDGTRIYMEHISHHPPISSYLIEGPEEYAFKMYGSVEFKGQIKNKGNVLNIFFEGANYVEFPDGHVIEFHYPTTRVSGLMWGERTVNIEGTGILIDHKNDTRGIVVFNPDKPQLDLTTEPTSFEGLIYTSDSKEIQKKKIASLGDVTDIDEEICDVWGDVLDHLKIDGEEFWAIDEYTPYRYFPMPTSLPSDCRYREDLLWLKYEDLKYSQEWKGKLEVQQRHDKKMRLDGKTFHF